MLRDPFKSGDQVRIGDHEGTIEGVTVRETLLRGHDGRRYFIPNAKVMTGVIEVETDRSSLRQSFPVTVDLGADLDHVQGVITSALRQASGVLDAPPPDAVVTDISDGTVTISCRFWSGSRRSEITTARDRALRAVAAALVGGGIDPPVDEVQVRLTGGTGQDPT